MDDLQAAATTQLGTPAYMAPEQIRGERIDRRADVWALGVLLYELLTLRLPFRSGSREELFREILASEPPRVSRVARSLPEDLALVVATAMAKDPAERYATARELAEDLQRLLRHQRIHARRPPAWLRARRWTQRHPVVTAVVAVLAIALGGTLLQQSELRGTLRHAKALALAAEAQKALAEDPTLSLLLARAALATEVNLETRSAAISALARSHCAELHEFDSAPRQAMWFGRDPQGIVVRTDAGLLWKRGGSGWQPLSDFDGACDLLLALAGGDVIAARELSTQRLLAWRCRSGAPPERLALDLPGVSRLYREPHLPLLLAHRDQQDAVLLDFRSGLHHELPLRGDRVRAVSFAPDCDRLAVVEGPEQSVVRILATDGTRTCGTVAHRDRVIALRFAADGRLLTGGEDRVLRSFDLHGGAVELSPPHEAAVIWIVAADAAPRAITRDRIGFLYSWDLEHGRLMWRQRTNPVSTIAITADGSHVAAALGNRVRVFDRHGEVVMVVDHASDIGAIWFSADGRRLLTSSSDRTVRVWDLSPPPVPILLGSAGWIREVDWSPDGGTIVTAGGDGILRLWASAGGPALLELVPPDGAAPAGGPGIGGFTSVRFTPDGRSIAAGSYGSLWLFALDGTLRQRIALPGDSEVPRLSFDRDGGRIVVCVNRNDRDNGVHVLALAGPEPGQRLAFAPAKAGLPYTAAFVADGSAIAVGDDQGCIRILDAATLAERVAPWQAHRRPLQVGLITPIPGTDRFASTGFDGVVRIWDVRGMPHGELFGHSNGVKGCAVHGDRLATAGFDGTVRLWDLEELACLAILQGHEELVFDVRFSPDGGRLVSGSMDRTARIWPARLEELPGLLASRIVRGFRREERDRFADLLPAGR